MEAAILYLNDIVTFNCVFYEFIVASFPGPTQLSVLQVTESWAGPGNEAKFSAHLTLMKKVSVTRNLNQTTRLFLLGARTTGHENR